MLTKDGISEINSISYNEKDEKQKLPVSRIEDIPDLVLCDSCGTLNYLQWQIEKENRYDTGKRTFYFHCSNPLCRARIEYFYVE